LLADAIGDGGRIGVEESMGKREGRVVDDQLSLNDSAWRFLLNGGFDVGFVAGAVGAAVSGTNEAVVGADRAHGADTPVAGGRGFFGQVGCGWQVGDK